MKRIATLALAATMALGSFTSAQAAEVSFSGEYVFTWGWLDNVDGANGTFNEGESDHFVARQRVRLQTEFKATDYLKGVVQAQVVENDWGSDTYHRGGSGDNFQVRRAYLDWTIPDSCLNFKIGLADFALPFATGYGNPVFSSRAAGIQMNIAATDNISANVFWLRPSKVEGNDSNRYKANDFDLFGVTTDFNFDSFRVQPWVMYGSMGANSGDRYSSYIKADDSADMYWGGLGLEVTPIDQLSVKFDGIYGYADFDNKSGGADRLRGWLLAMAIDYEMDFGTPGVFGWYGSGNKRNSATNGKFNTLPVVAPDGFGPTSFAFDGAFGINDAAIVSETGAGTWGVGLQIADVSFLDKLSHTFRVAYISGTNHKDSAAAGAAGEMGWNSGDSVYMTHHDHLVEFNIDSTYQIYENLEASLELGYIITDFDDGNSSSNTWAKDHNDKNAVKASVGLLYRF